MRCTKLRVRYRRAAQLNKKKKEELLERILLHLNFEPASLCSESKLWLYFAGGGAADEQKKIKSRILDNLV